MALNYLGIIGIFHTASSFPVLLDQCGVVKKSNSVCDVTLIACVKAYGCAVGHLRSDVEHERRGGGGGAGRGELPKCLCTIEVWTQAQNTLKQSWTGSV